MRRITYILSLLLLSTLTKGQNLVGYEYWFDTDYPSKVYTAHIQEQISFEADVSTFSQGLHYITFRAKDSEGKWSPPLTQYFYRTSTDNGGDNALNSYEYWIDKDITNKKTTESTNGTIILDLDVTTLTQGVHYLNFRAKDKPGHWSNLLTQYFYRTSTDNGADNALNSYEYWIDKDITNKKTTESTNGTIILDLDVTTLTQGVHYLNFRAKDKLGHWSNLLTQYFYRTSTDNGADNALSSYEYWIDKDVTNKKTSESTNGTIIFDLDVSSLERGVHYLNFRAKDKLGNWSSLLTQYFVCPLENITKGKISNYAYWLNDDLNTLQTGNFTPTEVLQWDGFLLDIPEAIIPKTMPESIQLTSTSKEDGTATFSWTNDVQLNLQFKDEAERWSVASIDTFAHTSKQTIDAKLLTLNKGNSFQKPVSRALETISIDINKEDSVYWKADQPCILSVFNPKNELVYTLSGSDILTGKKIKTEEKGTYYALLHDATHDETYNKDAITIVCIGQNTSDTIHVEPAGTLPELAGDPEAIVNLTLTGYLNGTDIKFIRSLKNLQRLDISGARIVEGGDKYYQNYLTANDITGDYMFCNLPNLTRLVLSNHTTKIATAALSNCTGLTEIEIPASVTSIEKAVFNGCNQLLLINWNAQAAITAESFDTPAKMGNLLIFAPEGTGCTYEGNVVINGMAEKISLTHGKGFRSPQAFKAKDITYKRNFSMKSGNKINAAGWEAIVLPFDVQSFSNEKQGELAPFNSGKKGAKPFWLAQMTTDGFEHTTAMKANKPYIISLPNSESYEDEFNISGEVQFHAEDADGVEVKATSYKELARIEGSNRIMVPAYETVFKHDTIYAINPATYENIAPGGAFVRNLRDVQPFEAYLISKEAAVNAPKLYSIGGIGGEITGIEELPSDALDGIEIYVRYGVLYIKSDRERTLSIYDTAGHMVRQVEVQEGTTAVTGLGKGIYLLARKKILVQ
ncbi:leucine-rich repeat protein [Bacteroides sp. 14(A)]|uniref:leucine-rich repeat protein n=1 Tax=Bacteroides sp. 14(A) TaxID=1163670 RepID=UPI0004B20C4F|nr:leucine-rich repeat protein [Bacteroides sp. 14(A)]